MLPQIHPVRPFIGAKNFETVRAFYRRLGFIETILSHNLSLFASGKIAFYLLDAYVEDWLNNTMVFMEVTELNRFYETLRALSLEEKYPGVRLIPIRDFVWGRECYLHDPSGILWHFGEFSAAAEKAGEY